MSFVRVDARCVVLLVVSLLVWLGGGAAARAVEAEVRPHLGKPTLFVDGKPLTLAAYSPAGFSNRKVFEQELSHFRAQPLNAYFVCIGSAKQPPDEPGDFWATPFWKGDTISPEPLTEFHLPPDEQAAAILEGRPESLFIVRFSTREPASWRRLHPDDCVVTDSGEALPHASLASDRFWEDCGRQAAAVIEYAEGRPWADRIVGYANFLRLEGTHEPMLHYALFDHGPVMTARWRKHLRDTYGTVEKLRAAHGDNSLTFETVAVPTDRLAGNAVDLANLDFFLAGAENGPLRDYLLLQRDLFHAGFRRIAAAAQATLDRLGRKRVIVHDSHKSVMLGWDNTGFFDAKAPWRHAYPELMAGSGNMSIAGLFDGPGIGGLITPHDYQARGLGGVFEPEGVADSAVLRGKLMLCEMDTRPWAGTDPIAPARDAREFAAITWRNIATSLTRGITPYWMDVHQDWFAPDSIQPVIRRQAEVLKESVDWPHETVPGIAMSLDDEAVLETNGDGRFQNEAVLWEWKTGLVRAGVPVRKYLVDDLALANFPKHKVFYFPNLFRADDKRLALLKEKVLRRGHVVVWGPGSGVSDGTRIGAESATRLTGFSFEMLPINDPRRTLLSNTSHPLTKGLSPATLLGGPLAYGPVLFPTDGTPLGIAWTKLGKNLTGFAVKEVPAADGTKWTSVFTTSPGLPAAFWRNCARHSGTHVWCDDDELVMADSGIVALHSVVGGPTQQAAGP
ncbi:MAG: hypothetical protein ACKOWG_03320 [Planctomycetia bacterium]